MTLIILALFGILALALLSADWRSGILITVVIGFAQDPIRKLAPGQPGFFVGLVLIAFLATSFVLWQQRGGRFDLPQLFSTTPGLSTWLSALIILVIVQAFHGLLLWDVPPRVLIGVGFYFAPLLGLWMGFQLGLNQFLLRRFLHVYLCCTFVFAITAFLDYRGVDIPLFQAVGGGQIIHFRYGFYTSGAIGLWRSTDIAAMHLTIAACLSISLAFSQENSLRRNLWLLLSGSFALVSLLTGRRKAVVQIILFFGLFFFFLSRYAHARSRPAFFPLILTILGLSSIIFILDPSELLGDDFGEYISRAESAPLDLWSRFNVLGVEAFQRGLEISNGIGIGVGTLAQTGAARIASIEGESFQYVSESGLGKVVAELGIPGLLIFSFIAFGMFNLVRRNLRLVWALPHSTSALLTGLLAFAISNLPFFSSAAGIYGDPFILILCGLCFGSFLAVPHLAHDYHINNHSEFSLSFRDNLSGR